MSDEKKKLKKMKNELAKLHRNAKRSSRENLSSALGAVGTGLLSSWAYQRAADRARNGGETGSSVVIDSELLMGAAATAASIFMKNSEEKEPENAYIMCTSIKDFIDKTKGNITRIYGYKYNDPKPEQFARRTRVQIISFPCKNKSREEIADIIVTLTHDLDEKEIELHSISYVDEKRREFRWIMR